MVALLAGLAVLAAVRWSARATAAAVVALAAAGVVIAIAASGRLHLNLADPAAPTTRPAGATRSCARASTSSPTRPVAGYGSASFSCEFLRHTRALAAPQTAGVTSDSHTIPVTIAAEQGDDRAAWPTSLLLAACGWRLASGPTRAARGARRRSSPRSRRSSCTPGPTRTSSRTRSPGRCSRSGTALAPLAREPAATDVRVYLKRLLTAGLAYQAGDILSKGDRPLHAAALHRATSAPPATATRRRC